MDVSQAIWTTIAGFLTLAIYSFLYRDNKVYKFAEHLFVGTAAGYYVAIQYRSVFRPNLVNPLLDGDLWKIIPLILGVMLFMRLLPKGQWLSRWPMAVMVGAFAGLQLIGFLQGDLIEQIRANLVSLDTGRWTTNVNNLLLIIGVLTSLVYFFFSVEHKGAIGAVSRVGIYFLMISFGASYGFTVMARISLLIGRLEFLFGTWPASFGATWLRLG